MKTSMEREKELESLIEALIRMLGKSNERLNNLEKRVNQLEWIVREMVMYECKPDKNQAVYAN
jgi:hypothetical protein